MVKNRYRIFIAVTGFICLLLTSAIQAGEAPVTAGQGAQLSPAREAGGGTPPHSWLREARIAGATFNDVMPDYRIQGRLDALVREGVTVLQGNSALSYYLTDDELDRQLKLVARTVSYAHERGLKVLWYFPTLEVITPGGRLKKGGALLREHPDWLQRSFDRRKPLKARVENADEDSVLRQLDNELMSYYYGSGKGPLENNDEDLWVCPNSPYRSFYMERVEKLVSTGVDGIWFDGPRFNTYFSLWNCACSHCREKYRKETGTLFPARADFADTSFRNWVLWRHRTLAEFLDEAVQRAHGLNPALRCVVEVAGCDNLVSTREGLDGSWVPPAADVAWRIDSISDTTGMRDATVGDWLSMMVTYLYCGGRGPGKVNWAFSSGVERDDSQLIMAMALAAQCNPCETRTPRQAASVGTDFRTEMFNWIQQHSAEIFESTSRASTGLLYSPENRDFIDGTEDGGFYLTATPPTPAVKWWVRSHRMVLSDCKYLSEYKGWGMFLIRNHLPFDVVSLKNAQLQDLCRYRALILPNTVCLSEETRAMLLSYTSRGGHLIVTGAEAGLYDGTGARRGASCWSAAGAISKGAGAGRGETPGELILLMKQLPGKAFAYGKGDHEKAQVLSFMKQAGIEPLVPGTAPLYITHYESGKDVILHLVNYGWAGQKKLRVENTSASVILPVGAGVEVKTVTVSSPGDKERWVAVPFTTAEGRVSFKVDVGINQLVKVEIQ